ncbi:MAG TPA: beta-ketoacyl-[acyl-carrier-protein] synthase family protein [Chloroflexota bacterium]|nr:beta-ketoacyl-[acyl-carrier-protein] synthase family protein [Chloroflexota bacterium]
MRAGDLRPDDVVVTGRGVISPIGNSLAETLPALREGRSGLSIDPDFVRLGFRCHVAGRIQGLEVSQYLSDPETHSMSRTSLYSTIAAIQAVREAGLTPVDLERDESGVVLGCGLGSAETIIENGRKLVEQSSPRRIGSHGVDRTMASTCAANATVYFKTRGVGEALSSACATGLHNIGYAYRLIKHGYQDTVLCGAGDEDGWASAHCFDAMRVLCADSNECPERASRPLDRTRAGFVPAGGAGVVVLESAARAMQRGAKPLARVAGYWSSTDGSGDMTAPSSEGQRRLVRMALRSGGLDAGCIDYVNLHATSTPTGDVAELVSLAEELGEGDYLVSASKSQIGHALGAAGGIELIFCLLMLEHGFVAPSLNIEELDPLLEPYRERIAAEVIERPLRYVMSNNFGFGNTNGSMILERVDA